MPQNIDPNAKITHRITKPSEVEHFIEQGLLTIEEALRLADYYVYSYGNKTSYMLARLERVSEQHGRSQRHQL